MHIFVYSDESGVLDKVHNEVYVFGGIVFLSKEDRDVASRKYNKAERDIRISGGYARDVELKASVIGRSEKRKLYRSLNGCYKFGAVVEQSRVFDSIMADKKSKQRFLDYVYKMGVKRLLEELIRMGEVNPAEVEHMYFFVDEHTTSTNGIYELQETLESEFKRGAYAHDFTNYFPPLFPELKSLELKFCNSSKKTLVRAADIVANRIYHDMLSKITVEPFDGVNQKLYLTYLP